MISVDGSSAVPAYEQIRAQITGMIRVGSLQSGHRLPSIRQLAGDLAIAPGTVARAFTELESAGLIESTRVGTFVRESQPLAGNVRDAADDLARSSIDAGLSIDDAIAALRACWSGWPGRVEGL